MNLARVRRLMLVIALTPSAIIANAQAGTGFEGSWNSVPPGAQRAWVERQREKRLHVMMRSNRGDITWGNERRPSLIVVLELDPPLEKTNGDHIVEVELFSTFVDDDGFTELQCRARELTLGTWWPSVAKSGEPVRLVHRQVDQGPGLDNRYRETRRKIAELLVGSAWYANEGDERGAQIVEKTMERLRGEEVLKEITAADVDKVLTEAEIDAEEWVEKTTDEIKVTRTRDNDRWRHFATQYFNSLGTAARAKPQLAIGASPILLVDGKYLVTMNTVWRKGGRRAPERLFQTLNHLVRNQLEQSKRQPDKAATDNHQEITMNYTAAALATATMLLASCAPTSYDPDSPQPWRGGWKVESGKVEILPDAAHLRMKRSGTVLRIIFLEPLEGEQASEARRYIGRLTEDREISCGWPHGWGTKDNPMTMSDEGHPIASCKLVEAAKQASCTQASCFLGYRVLRAGYGKYAAGPWEHRTENNQRVLARKRAAANAKKMKIGIWK